VKSISVDLQALFDSNINFMEFDLFTITLQDGTIIRTTNCDRALTFSGTTWQSDAPIIDRTKTKTVIGTQVDTMTLTIKPQSSETVQGMKYQKAARLGTFDGATVLVESAYLTTYPNVIGKMHVFSGLVGEVDPSKTQVEMQVKSALQILQNQFPRNVFQASCSRVLYGTGCGVTRATYTFTGALTATPTDTNTITTNITQADGEFSRGVIKFTSGVNNGVRRNIKTSLATGVITFSLPLDNLPANGDTFTVTKGCDKLWGTCGSRFSNQAHFRAFKNIPSPETVR